MKKLLSLSLFILMATVLQAQVLGGRPNLVALTVADLKTKVGYQGQYCQLLGGSATADGSQGLFYYDTSLAAANDDALVIRITGLVGNGGWRRFVANGKYSASWWGLVAGGADQATKLNAIISAVPNNATIELDNSKTYNIAASILITKPVTILGNNSTLNYTGTDSIRLVSIRSSNVIIDRLNITSSGTTYTSGYASNSHGISTELSTNTSFYSGIKITNCTITGYRSTGIWLEFIRDFIIQDNTIKNFPYGGIIAFSCVDGKFQNNTIDNITALGRADGNAYGIAIIRKVSVNTDTVPRNIAVTQNKISNVPWEGIDTHGGEQLGIENNFMTNCNKGIAMVSTGNLAPNAIRVTGNTIDNDGLTTAEAAIQIDGLSSTVLATGIVVANNTMKGSGFKSSYTEGLVFASNTVERPSQGFGVYYDQWNLSSAIINNKFYDVWQSTNSNSAAIKFVSGNNQGYIDQNYLIDGGFTGFGAGNKNRWGFRPNTAQSTDQPTLGTNYWTAATNGDFDPATCTYCRFYSNQAQGTRRYNAAFTVAVDDYNIIYDGAAVTATMPAINTLNKNRTFIISNQGSGNLTLSTAIYLTNSSSTTTIAPNEAYIINVDATNSKFWGIPLFKPGAITYADDEFTKYIAALGGSLIAETAGAPYRASMNGQNLASGTARVEGVIARKTTTATGVRVMLSTQGVFTSGTDFNGVALYTYSGGTLTQVAKSTTNATLFSSAVGYLDIPFASTYNVTAGTVYFVGLLYTSASQTTAPQLRGGTAGAAALTTYPGLTNSAKLSGVIASQTDLLTSYTMATNVNSTSAYIWVSLY